MVGRFQWASFQVWLLAVLCGLTICTPWAAAQTAGPASLILHNGKILTVDNNFSTAEAVAVTGKRITAVGSNADILKLKGANTQVIDLKGRTVVPGLVDTHRHMYSAAEGTHGGLFSENDLRRYPVDWRGVNNKDDVLNQIKGQMDQYKFRPGEWIYFTNQLSFMGEGSAEGVKQATILYDDLNQWELDKVTPNNPIMMSLGIPDFNGFLLNKKAMDLIWAKYGDFMKKNGRVWVDASGRPDGHLEPPASRLVLPYTYDRSPQVLSALYKPNMEENASMGLTTIITRLPNDALGGYRLLETTGELIFRVGYGVIEPFGNVTDLDNGLKQYATIVGTGTDKIWVTGLGPTATDGMTSRACTDQKRTGTYSAIDAWFPMGQCHTDIEYRGSPKRAANISDNYYRNWAMASARDGVRWANVHIAGDRATGTMLNIVESAQKEFGTDSTKTWAFDHCDMVNPADFKRIARLGITMSCYVLHSIHGSQAIADAYGEKIAHTFPSPLKSMVDAGARVVMESDSNSYIWEDLEAAINRKDRKGKVWAPQERLDRPTTLRMMTSWAADYALKLDQLGTIEKGKLADLLVLDKDYMTVPEDNISDLQPQLNVFDGRIVFVHPQFAQEYNLKPVGAVVSTYKDLIAKRKARRVYGGGG